MTHQTYIFYMIHIYKLYHIFKIKSNKLLTTFKYYVIIYLRWGFRKFADEIRVEKLISACSIVNVVRYRKHL